MSFGWLGTIKWEFFSLNKVNKLEKCTRQKKSFPKKKTGVSCYLFLILKAKPIGHVQEQST